MPVEYCVHNKTTWQIGICVATMHYLEQQPIVSIIGGADPNQKYDIKVSMIILCKRSFAIFRRVATLYKLRPTLLSLQYITEGDLTLAWNEHAKSVCYPPHILAFIMWWAWYAYVMSCILHPAYCSTTHLAHQIHVLGLTHDN